MLLSGNFWTAFAPVLGEFTGQYVGGFGGKEELGGMTGCDDEFEHELLLAFFFDIHFH